MVVCVGVATTAVRVDKWAVCCSILPSEIGPSVKLRCIIVCISFAESTLFDVVVG
jgi:hypothetical protein